MSSLPTIVSCYSNINKKIKDLCQRDLGNFITNINSLPSLGVPLPSDTGILPWEILVIKHILKTWLA